MCPYVKGAQAWYIGRHFFFMVDELKITHTKYFKYCWFGREVRRFVFLAYEPHMITNCNRMSL